jgi:hypothetical protein
VDDVRIGRLVRALRERRGLRQQDLARDSGLSQTLVSLVERGHLGSVSHGRLRRLFAALEARYEGDVSWRGGAIDRLLDERHAQLVGATVMRVRRTGWDADVEVSFNSYGDRGSIDILAVRPERAAIVVIEIKTELTSIEETIRRLDVKERLAPDIVFARLGWRPHIVGRLLVLAEGATNRRRAASHAAVLAAAFQHRGDTIRAWMRNPEGRRSGLLISSPSTARNGGQGSRLRRTQSGASLPPSSTAAVRRRF